MIAIRLFLATAAILLAGCADVPKDWGADDPLDGFQGIRPMRLNSPNELDAW